MKWKGKWIIFYAVTIIGVLIVTCWGSRTVSVIAQNTPVPREHCIVIDAGHGGVDGGATSSNGRLESAYNLEIALRLNDLLMLLGHHTRMTRMTDTSIYTKGETIAQQKASDLKERVRIVNETEGGLLLSIHQNNFSDSKYHGAQVFYAKTDGSKQLAFQLQSALVATINPNSNRKSKPGNGIYLMEHIQRTGILIECGFLSNAQEEAMLRDPEYQKQLCCVISAAVNQYLSNT